MDGLVGLGVWGGGMGVCNICFGNDGGANAGYGALLKDATDLDVDVLGGDCGAGVGDFL